MANIFDGIGPTTTSSQTINKKKNLFDDIGPENDFKITTEGDTNDVGISAINNIGPGTIADNTSAWDYRYR